MRALLLTVLSLATFAAAVAWQAKDAPADNRSEPGSPPKWFKGNLHTHSLWSDGDDFPEMIADWYRREGYHFLVLTEHNVIAEGQKWVTVPEKGTRPQALEKYRKRFGDDWVERRMTKGEAEVRLKPLAEFRSLLEQPGRFLLIPGEEITGSFGKRPVHINAINLRDVINPAKGASVAETISATHRATAAQAKAKLTGRRILTFLNHPNFGWGVNAEDMIAAEELRFFEVYNGHPGVRNDGDKDRPSTERLWDIVLSVRLGKLKLPPLYGLGTDDAHNYHRMAVGQSNPGRGWVCVQAPHLTPEAIVSAIEAGRFYATSGVELEQLATEGELRLKVKARPGVKYRTQFIATMRDATLTTKPATVEGGSRAYSEEVGKVVAEVEGPEATYRPTGKELYVRARVISTKAHPNPFKKGDVEMAWTQPLVP